MLTPVVDANSRLQTGFAHVWIKALAERVDQLTVLCRTAGKTDLPSNVTVIGLDNDHSMSNLQLVVAFARAVHRHIGSVDVVFTHLRPRYTLIAGPMARLRGIPLIYWNANAATDEASEVWLAHRLANRVVTATQESYKYSDTKVSVIGHGIDFDAFVPTATPIAGERLIVSAGRLSPIKNIEIQIEAAALLLLQPGLEDVKFVVAGEEPWWSRDYKRKVESKIAAHGLSGRFQLRGGVPFSEIGSFYQGAALLLSTSKTGSLDKVVLEAMGCGLPTLVTGEVYLSLLDKHRTILFGSEHDARDLADRLARLLSMNPVERRELGLDLRRRAVAAHSLDDMMDRMVDAFMREIRILN